jgi:hypothetical protein
MSAMSFVVVQIGLHIPAQLVSSKLAVGLATGAETGPETCENPSLVNALDEDDAVEEVSIVVIVPLASTNNMYSGPEFCDTRT